MSDSYELLDHRLVLDYMDGKISQREYHRKLQRKVDKKVRESRKKGLIVRRALQDCLDLIRQKS